MEAILDVTGLTYAWPTAGTILDSLSLKFNRGSLTAVLGRNGVGKTTFVKLLCGLLRPRQGQVTLRSEHGTFNMSDREPAALNEVFFVPESSELPDFVVGDFGKVTGALYSRFDGSYFRDNLQRLEINERERISRLSYGQKRKTHIAFALATQAKVLFLDEPSNGLDIASQIALRKLLIASVSDDRSIILSTHHVREFEHVFDRAIVLDKGRVLADVNLEGLQSSSDFVDLESWYINLINMGSHSEQGRHNHGNL